MDIITLKHKYSTLQDIINDGTKEEIDYAMSNLGPIPWDMPSILRESVHTGARKGCISVIKFTMGKGICKWDDVATTAAKYGHMDIVQYIYDSDVLSTIKYIANGAATGGHMDIIDWAISHGYTDIEEIIVSATIGGHIDIIIDIHDITTSEISWERIADVAVEYGYLDIVKYAVEMGADDYNSMTEIAASNGHMDIIKYLATISDLDWDNVALSMAASTNTTLDNIIYAIQHGATNVEDILYAAAENGYVDIVKYIIPLCDEYDKEKLISYAEYGGHDPSIYGI